MKNIPPINSVGPQDFARASEKGTEKMAVFGFIRRKGFAHQDSFYWKCTKGLYWRVDKVDYYVGEKK